jgi:superfamily I DNA and/or RNA helicase
MSTFQVSEILPSKFGSFDLVIIDEASQSDIMALPAIMRAKKILIVGDDKQVSPNAGFTSEEKIIQLKHSFLTDQPFKNQLLPGNSIYDLATTIFPSQKIMLTEHFRCAEPIIQFSMQFYNGQLVPLRIPKESERLIPPLVDVHVKNGIRDEVKNINELEARAILEEIKQITKKNEEKKRTIGVISLTGFHQARYIQGLLLSELGEEIYELYRISCGDAATFQGKEKDIIFLSMVVGNKQGSVLNKREDEQRMNVTLSRAKDRMYLYRSIDEKELGGNESNLRGKILRFFSNPMPIKKTTLSGIELCDSFFEREVFQRLQKLSYNVTPQVKVEGFSIDLVVEGENDQRLAIELDGDRYHQPEKGARDWERQRTLERVGWTFWRCWGSNYFRKPKECFDDLVSKLDEMKIKPIKATESRLKIYTEKRTWSKTLKDFQVDANE